MTAFALDPQLAADSVAVASLSLSDLRLVDDSRFPWVMLVPRRAGATEIIDLEKADRAFLFEEITAVSAALKQATACEKLNVAALGNQVRQLHVHIVARFAGDLAWPGPIWGKGASVGYRPEAREALVERIRRALAS
jgi:diadenosine tetraphosphate (Ap4A) HIT family hydrolase